jgi:type VI secretion system protein ImpF
MARHDTRQNVTQSVLDRLIDREPSSPKDSPVSAPQSVRQLKVSLRRDLEWLLNTRRTPEAASTTFQNLSQSVFNFGLPDVTSLSYENHSDRARLLHLVESTVRTFEPRLTRVKVTQLEAPRGAMHVVRFQIEGMLMMDPEPEHISFDTVLQLASGHYDVKGEPSA